MDKTIKIFGIFLLMFATFVLPGCGSDKDDEPIVSATVSEIQGTWHNASYGIYRTFTFKGNEYYISLMDIKTSRITDTESGTFTLRGTKMTLVRKSGQDISNGDLDVYWTNKMKNVLKIYPMGEYTRSK